MDALGWQDRHQAYQGLRATLHAHPAGAALEEMASSGPSCRCSSAASTMRGWDPTGQPHKARHTAELLAPIWHHFAS